MFKSVIFEKWAGSLTQKLQDASLRHLKKYFNAQPPFQLDEALLSGSWCEGLAMQKIQSGKPVEISDVDFMCIIKNISFSEEDQACGNLTVKEDTPFVNAYITNQESLKMWEDFLEDPTKDTSKRLLSARKLKAMLHENYKKMGNFFQGISEQCKTIGDGPSIELKKELPNTDTDDPFEYSGNMSLYKIMASSDIIVSIRCNGWPSNASEWLERDRVWPDKELVQKICQEGFHIVPKTSLEGDFRLSFSNAEATLIENLTPLQHQVIRAFKAVIKYHQSSWISPNIKDIICSYHLKTIFFWHVEKSTQDSWTEDTVVSHLLSLLDEFARALRKGNLPMYFLPKYNLLENVGNHAEEMKMISEKVEELLTDTPAITTAVKKLANINVSDVFYRELYYLPGKIIEKVMKVVGDGSAGPGNESRMNNESMAAVQDESGFGKLLENFFDEFKEETEQVSMSDEFMDFFDKVEQITNLTNVIFKCYSDAQSEEENKTFLSLD